jgi:hypothetical protein
MPHPTRLADRVRLPLLAVATIYLTGSYLLGATTGAGAAFFAGFGPLLLLHEWERRTSR